MTQLVLTTQQFRVVVQQGLQRSVAVSGGGARIVVSRAGAPGPAGAGVSYLHTQSSAAAEWIVNHNLGFKPAAAVLDSGGSEVLAEVIHVSTNQLRVYFASPQIGTVRCT